MVLTTGVVAFVVVAVVPLVVDLTSVVVLDALFAGAVTVVVVSDFGVVAAAGTVVLGVVVESVVELVVVVVAAGVTVTGVTLDNGSGIGLFITEATNASIPSVLPS